MWPMLSLIVKSLIPGKRASRMPVHRWMFPVLLFALQLPSANPQGLPRAIPEEVGISSARLRSIDPVMEDFVARSSFPGMTVCVAREGKLVYRESFGHADIATRFPVQADSIFRIFSMTKPVTAVAVLMLFEKGKLALDDPVSRYIPAMKEVRVYRGATPSRQESTSAREMTIRDLLRHTSGLGYGWDDDPVSRVYRSLNLFDPASTLEQAVAKLAQVPLYFEPGTQWKYSVSIDLLGRLVEVLSGKTLEEYFQDQIFNPLKMQNTGFYVPQEKLPLFTALYQSTSDGTLVPLPEASAVGRYDRNRNRLLSGGGGLVSTADDYLRFAQMLVNGGELDGVRILGPRTVALMGMNHLPKGITLPWDKLRGHGYGLGVSVLTDLPASPGMGTVGDWGWDGAASTYFRVDPVEKLVILLMTHRMPCDTEIQVKLKTLVYQAIER